MSPASHPSVSGAPASVTALEHFASPAALRNAGPLAEALSPVLPVTGTILEVASGSGFHAAVLASAFPGLKWQPTEADPSRLTDLQDLAKAAQLPNLLTPFHLDATVADWPTHDVQGVLCLNMIHIAPWQAAKGLMRGASEVLAPGSCLYLYGPFKIDGRHTAPSNESFDQNLRARNPEWGVRDSNDVDELAGQHGLSHEGNIEMPANNMVRIYCLSPKSA
jgi:hypothetical protein